MTTMRNSLLLILSFVNAKFAPELIERRVVLGVRGNSAMPRCAIP